RVAGYTWRMTASRAGQGDGPSLVDGYGRVARSLRLSVTDRCNLRCLYCMPAGEIPWFPKARILTFEEIERVVRILAANGVRDVHDDQIERFADLALHHPYQVRFIEMMPLGGGEPFELDRLVPGGEVKRRIESTRTLVPARRDRPSAPASVYRLQGGAGDIGF